MAKAMSDPGGYLPMEKIIEIVNKAKESVSFNDPDRNFRDYMVLFTLTVSGRRVSEIVGNTKVLVKKKGEGREKNKWKFIDGMKPQDINKDEGYITFKILKKKDKTFEENILVPKEYIELLLFYIEKMNIKDTERIFPFTRQTVDNIVKKYSKMVGIEYIRKRKMSVFDSDKRKVAAHIFRHSFAIHLAKSGANIKMIQDFLVHSNMDITSTYLKFADRDKRKIVSEAW